MSRRRWRMVPQAYTGLVVALIVAAALGACGRSGASATAAEIHERWLTALRANDREQALALFVDTASRDVAVDSKLRMMQRYMFSTTTTGPYATGGLVDVQAIRLEDRGAGKRAWSRWQYVKVTNCHITDLTNSADGWRVTDYNLTASGGCDS